MVGVVGLDAGDGIAGDDGVDGGSATLEDPPCSFSAILGTGLSVAVQNYSGT